MTEAETDTETGEPSEPREPGELAPGVRIEEVLVNQGVAVKVADNAQWVAANLRRTRLIAGRTSLVQIRFERDPTSDSREIDVWLVLEHPTRELEPLVATAPASTDTRVEVDILLDPSLGHTDADVTFRVELRDLADAPPVAGELDIPVSPSEGPSLVGFEVLELVPEVVLVPISSVGVPAPEIDAEQIHRHLMARMPATRIELSVHEPITMELGNSLSSGFTPMSMLMEEEQPSPDASYIGLVYDPATEFDFTAFASGQPNPMEHRHGMVALEDDELLNAERLAFVLYTHSSMRHVTCPGDTYPVNDTQHPYADGKIGVWGWDMATDRLFDPAETYDASTWCDPRWISDYTWSKVLEALRISSAW